MVRPKEAGTEEARSVRDCFPALFISSYAVMSP